MTEHDFPTPHVSPQDIEDYFDRYGWSFSRIKDETWQTGFRGNVSSFRIMVQLTDDWVYLVINPFVVGPQQPEKRLKLYHHLLRLNQAINMAKFGIDRDGDVFLAVELPTEGFTYSHFKDGLDALSHYADTRYRDIFELAHGDHVETDYTLELDDPDTTDDQSAEP